MKKVLKYIGLSISILFLIFLVIKWEFVKLNFESFSEYLFPNNENNKGELFKILLSIIGAIAVMFGLYVAYRRAKAMERGVEKQGESIQNQNEQLKLSRKSQIDERFKNAIEHLGSEKEPVILGGIAELHQIAIENKDDYAEVVFNILCSYIRTTANVYDKKADDINHTAIQTIVNYLFKKSSDKNLYCDFEANLGHTNLLGIDLNGCNLKKAKLSFCYLPSISDSNLQFSELSKSIFVVSKIIESNLLGSNLHGTIFQHCEIRNTSFDKINFAKSVFLGCEIEDSNFDNNTFSNVNFSASYIKNISLKNCSILSGTFYCAHLDKLDFSGLELFGGCDFRAVSFNKVQFANVITSSNFRGVDESINKHPQLYEERLKERVGKEGQINIYNLEYGKNSLGILTDKDYEEIINEIKTLEQHKIEKKK